MTQYLLNSMANAKRSSVQIQQYLLNSMANAKRSSVQIQQYLLNSMANAKRSSVQTQIDSPISRLGDRNRFAWGFMFIVKMK
ncbi:hypothetical protein OIU76_025537 [Salix suchowensis]|nr:hypothetical protein OIU76_025537 [Salix suchowensis]